jgi:hypothetical protein
MKVQLTEAEFDRFVRLVQAVDLIEARHRIDLATATAKRNAYYATLAAAHQLPATPSTIGFDDETHTIDFDDRAYTRQEADMSPTQSPGRPDPRPGTDRPGGDRPHPDHDLPERERPARPETPPATPPPPATPTPTTN